MLPYLLQWPRRSVRRMFRKGGIDGLTIPEGHSVFSATPHEQTWRGLSLLGEGRSLGSPCAAPRPSRWDSVDALLGPAELVGKRAQAAFALRSVLQALVQARHPGPPADEALGRLRNRGRGKDLGGRHRVSHLGRGWRRPMEAPGGPVWEDGRQGPGLGG